MFNQIGGLNSIGAPLPPNQIGGENFIRHVGSDKLILDFHEGSGTIVHDKSHCGNDGTLTNPTDLTWLRNELEFGGTNGYVSTTIDLTDYSEYTICIFFKGYQVGTNIFVGQSKVGDRVFSMRYITAAASGERLSVYDGVNVIYGDDISINDKCHFIAVEEGSGNSFYLYQNGMLKDSDDGNLPSSSAITLLIGCEEEVNYANTIMYFVSVLNKCLSGIECQNEYLLNKFSNN